MKLINNRFRIDLDIITLEKGLIGKLSLGKISFRHLFGPVIIVPVVVFFASFGV